MAVDGNASTDRLAVENVGSATTSPDSDGASHTSPPAETAGDAVSAGERKATVSAHEGNGARDPHDSAPAVVLPTAAENYIKRSGYFEQVLEDAERLLKHLAENGSDIDADVRANVVKARALPADKWTEQTAANLLIALTKLAAKVRPVTAESLRACQEPTVRQYWRVAIALAIVIVPFSLVSFVTSALSDAIRKDIVVANELAVKLTAQTGGATAPGPAATSDSGPELRPTKAGVLTELQQFAAAIRAIDSRTRQLNLFVMRAEKDPYASIRDTPKFRDTFELPPGLPNLVTAEQDKIALLQNVRYFAQSVLDDVSVFYGAITTCILPVLYALLGTCAYLLRCFEQQTSAKTFIPSMANSARFLIAAIAGAVVGLFNNFTISEGASIPPLAIAFLAGYAVDVFFSFLEGLIQAFTKSKPGAGPPSATPATS